MAAGDEPGRIARGFASRSGRLRRDEMQNLAGLSTDWLDLLGAEKRARETRFGASVFWVAAERLPMIQTIYPGCEVEPPLVAPKSERARHWERAEASRELVRGRMEADRPDHGGSVKRFLSVALLRN